MSTPAILSLPLIVFVIPFVVTYLLPLDRGRDALSACIDGIERATVWLSWRPLWMLPVTMAGYLACVIALVLLSPYITAYYIRRQS